MRLHFNKNGSQRLGNTLVLISIILIKSKYAPHTLIRSQNIPKQKNIKIEPSKQTNSRDEKSSIAFLHIDDDVFGQQRKKIIFTNIYQIQISGVRLILANLFDVVVSLNKTQTKSNATI